MKHNELTDLSALDVDLEQANEIENIAKEYDIPLHAAYKLWNDSRHG